MTKLREPARSRYCDKVQSPLRRRNPFPCLLGADLRSFPRETLSPVLITIKEWVTKENETPAGHTDLRSLTTPRRYLFRPCHATPNSYPTQLLEQEGRETDTWDVPTTFRRQAAPAERKNESNQPASTSHHLVRQEGGRTRCSELREVRLPRERIRRLRAKPSAAAQVEHGPTAHVV